ncbi:MAG: phosphoribosylformylglycinamidine synthase subunit PurS [Acidimicrobiales bacterium]
MRFSVLVEVQLRSGVADPAGATVQKSLPALGFEGVQSVRVGKAIRFELEAPSTQAAESEVAAMCDRFLTNPVIEDSHVNIITVM